MKRLLHIIVSLGLWVCFTSTPLCAQEEFSVEVLDLKLGLPSNFATKTVSDNKHFKYFATEAGLARYDGYTFKNYRPEPNKKGLLNENIETLLPSQGEYVWVGTKIGGLSRLNLQTQEFENWNDVFTTYTSRPLRVVSLVEDRNGFLWVGTWSMGCFKVDPAARKVLEHFPSKTAIYGLLCDAKGTVWYGDGKLLCAYRAGQGTLERYPQQFFVYALCQDTLRQRIWIAGNNEKGAALAWYDQLTDEINLQQEGMPLRYVVSLAIDNKMRLWMGSWGSGLHLSDKAIQNFTKVNTTGFLGVTQNNNHNAITNIYADDNGILWVTTAYGGVLIFYPNKGFKNITNNASLPGKDLNVVSLGTQPDMGMLAGSISGGLYSFKSASQPVFARINALPIVRINEIYTANAQFMVGTSDGLFVYPNGRAGAPQQFFPQEKINALLVADNYLWVGTQQHGLMRMPFTTVPDTAQLETFTESLPAPYLVENDRINKIVQDSRGRIWVATHAGLNLWSAKEQKFISHNSLFNNKLPGIIIHDLIVNDKFLYLATPNGLYQVAIQSTANNDVSLSVATEYNEQRGLVNQFICALQQDKNGNIWLSSVSGISKLNVHKNVFNHFGKRDGVQVNAFHLNASYKDAEGNIYFGGDNGFVFFNPEAVASNYQKPLVTITGLVINNVAVDVNSEWNGTPVLNTAIQYAKRLQLSYQRNHISIKFTSNDFLGASNISYAYKLLPKDKDWVLLGDRNELILSGLSPGKYQLLIRANRNNQGWGPEEVLELQIKYPPWLAWYAWIIYAALVAGAVWLVRRVRLRQGLLRHELQKVQFEKEKEHEINEAKINFFTNISHEFRTPLTLILSPCAELLENKALSPAEVQKLGLIKSNAQKLLKLINQLLDFRKSEHGLLALKLQNEDVTQLLQGIVQDFNPAAQAKAVNLKLTVMDGAQTLVQIDKAQLEIAINNLVSNAIKFTPTGGDVNIIVCNKESQLCIQVADSGIGIDKSHLDRIFQRFYQVSDTLQHNGGSGIGLAFCKNIIELHKGTIEVESDLGKGTTFTIQLPRGTISQLPGAAAAQEADLNEWSDEPIMQAGGQKTQAPSPTSILVIDDNADIRTYLVGMLSGEYQVFEAEDGSQGYKVVLDKMPDLIVSDVMMPQMNGIELCHELKSNMATSHIPVILLTARASEAAELEGLKTGADDYITKPFNPSIMRTRITNILENRKKLKEYYQKKVRFQPDVKQVTADNLDEVFLNKAIELVNQNMHNENLGIEMMVDHLFMSQSTLFRKIKALTGLSITGFIRALRLKKAAQLILQTNMKMSDVAMEVGFNDYKYFKKSFQQQFGCLPSDYRNQQAAKEGED